MAAGSLKLEKRMVSAALILCAGVMVSLLAACGEPAQSKVPVAPTNVTAKPGPGYIEVNWDHPGANLQSFAIRRSPSETTPAGTGSTGFVLAQADAHAVVPASERTFIDYDIEVGASYSYTVTAVGSGGSSQPAAAGGGAVNVEPGLAVMIGSYDHPLFSAPVTAVGVYLHFGDAPPPAGSYLRITGPAGWSAEEYQYVNLPDAVLDSARFLWAYLPLAPVPGEYLIELRWEHENYAVTSTTVGGFSQLPRATNIVADLAGDTVSASWSPVAGAVSYVPSVYRGSYSSSDVVVATKSTKDTAVSFAGIRLEAGTHFVGVFSMNIDRTTPLPPKVDQFAVSLNVSGQFAAPSPAACTTTTDVIMVPDAGLAAAIRAAVDLPSGAITCGHMQALDYLVASGRGVVSLEGLQHATNLTGLDVASNSVSDISQLVGLTDLEILHIENNSVTDLSPVAGLTELLALYANDNPITSIDAVAGLEKMVRIEIANTQVSTLEPLRNLSELFRVGAGRLNGLTDLSPLSGKPIASLYLNHNPGIADRSVIAEFTGLVHLLVGNTGWTDADMAMIANMPRLTSLQLWGNPEISDISAVAGLTDLLELDIGATAVTDVSAVHGLTEVNMLWLYGLGLQDSDVQFLADFTDLTLLRLDDNYLTDLAMLVDNVDIGAGTEVYVEHNCLDLTPASATMSQIDALLERGVNLTFEPQRDGCTL